MYEKEFDWLDQHRFGKVEDLVKNTNKEFFEKVKNTGIIFTDLEENWYCVVERKFECYKNFYKEFYDEDN
jgi:methionyl-tRNA synthetase